MWLVWWGVMRLLLEAPRTTEPYTLSMVAHTCHLTTQELEEGATLQGKPGLQSAILTSITMQNVTIDIIRPREELGASDFIQREVTSYCRQCI